MVDALLATDITDMNHSLYAFRHLHERAELSEARNRALDRSPDRKLLRSISPRIAQRLLQSQRHALFTGVHSKDHSLNCFAGFHQIARLAYFLDPRHFRNVDQSFNSWLQFNERAEVHHAGDGAAGTFADLVFVRDRIPRLRLKLFHSN